MADLIYRDAEGALKIGSDSNSEQLTSAIYRSTANKELVDEDGTFVERDLNGPGSRILFPAER
ncbi:MAG: hypothetical protein AAF351_01950 [Pseudomonadota bacterium]